MEGIVEFLVLRVDNHPVIHVRNRPFSHYLSTSVLEHFEGGIASLQVGINIIIVESDQEVFVFLYTTLKLLLLLVILVILRIVGMKANVLDFE